MGVRARGWGWRHGTRAAWAVRGLDLDVADGERVLLLGPSGAGKSTLLQGLAGLLDPETGDEEGVLELDGVGVRQARVDGVAAGVARTGLLLQDPLSQTVLARCGDDVAFGLENHAVPRDEIWPRVREALDLVGFPHGLDRSTSRLSGGERQRLALAGVLALRPRLLLLDEPTAMLDPAAADGLRRTVGRVLEETGAGCLLVEHRVAPWLPHVDRVVVLEPGGGVRADGPPAAVFAAHGEALARDGVWVPDRPPARPARRPGDSTGRRLLAAAGQSVARPGAAAPAARDVDLGLDAGTCTAVTGPNGAGKSTLALALAGLAAPTGGRLEASDLLADGAGPLPHRWRARALAARVGTVFQEPAHQFVATTVADELRVGPRVTGADPAAAEATVASLLERLGLARLAGAHPFTLSGGEQRRLSVATVLATRPRLLVLDEPTFGQDGRTWAELVALLDELRAEGVGVCAVTHDAELVAALADRVLRLPGAAA
ncbi:ABC transporter ATP-binding protein [Aquipuribacter hungaricus]|uniref:ABC transporter ATP-binding protein n=1 Tax=Aquipuribacter hungaricus TaxID=545624 RepID=UPI00360CAEEC